MSLRTRDAYPPRHVAPRRVGVWQPTDQLPGMTIPVPRFGSSDCRCPAHLVYFGERPPDWPPPVKTFDD
jgi:hypothetical protein